jgi:hypothetical protein
MKRFAWTMWNPSAISKLQIMAFLFLFSFFLALPSLAAPPVRIAVVPGGGSGIEQDVVDQISGQLQNTEDVVLSTVNPDWYVVCNVQEKMDQMSGQIRYNGTVTIKTTDGHVIGTYAVQKYNQDFSMSPGTPLNKALVDKAARDVIGQLANRAIGPLQQAVQIEMETRERVGKANELADQGKFDDALQLIEPITPDTPHFAQVQKLHEQLLADKQAVGFMQAGTEKEKAGRFAEALPIFRQVSPKSRLSKLAKQKVAECSAALTRKTAARAPSKSPTTTSAHKAGTTATTSTASEKDIAEKQKALMEEVSGAPR